MAAGRANQFLRHLARIAEGCTTLGHGLRFVAPYFLSKLSQFGSRSAAVALYALNNKIGFILVYPIGKTPLLQMGRLRLKLDPFHAMQRLSKLVLKSHGAYGAYMARLRDALFMVHSEDLAAVEAALRLLGKTPEEIEEKKKTDWAYFLQRCRRYDDS